MKTAEELFKKYTYAQYASPKTDKIIFSKKDEPIYITTKEAISDLLTEHDAETVKIIDEMVKHFESKYKRANKAKGYLATQIDEDMKTGIQVGKCEAYSKIIEALTELKEKLCVGSAG